SREPPWTCPEPFGTDRDGFGTGFGLGMDVVFQPSKIATPAVATTYAFQNHFYFPSRLPRPHSQPYSMAEQSHQTRATNYKLRTTNPPRQSNTCSNSTCTE